MLRQKVNYRGLLDSIDAPVMALKKDLQITYCNEAYARLLGKSLPELEGKDLLELCPEIIGSPSHLAYLEVLETGQSKVNEGKIANRYFGERIYKTMDGILIVADEISHHKDMEKALKTFASGHRLIFDEINEAILLLDVHSNNIMDVNRAACQIFACAREEILELNIQNLSAEEPPYTRDNLLRWIKTSSDMESQCIEWIGQDRFGRRFWIEIKAKQLLIGDEKQIVTIIRDINEHKHLKKDLRDSEDSYKDLFEKSDDFIFLHDLEGNFISVNQGAEKITGYWREEMLKMNIVELASNDYLQSLRSLVYRKIPRNKATNYELGIESKYGEQVFLDVSIWPIYKAGEVEPLAVQGIARDITQHFLEEAQLKADKEDLLSFIDFLPDATLAIDLNGKVVVWNQAMEALTGIAAKDMIGKGNYEYGLAFYNKRRPIMVDLVLRPEEVKKYYSVMEVDQYLVISEFDTPFLRGKGHYLWGHAMPWYDKNGNLLGAIESLRDITTRYKENVKCKEHEEKLKKHNDYLHSLINSLDASICSLDTEGRISFINYGFRKTLGYEGEELQDKNILEIVTEEYRNLLQELLKSHEKLIKTSPGELAFYHKNGSAILLNVNFLPVQEGQNSGIIIQA